MQFYEERVWFQLHTPDGENVLTGNHDFPSDALPNTTLNRFSCFSSENEPETKKKKKIDGGFKYSRSDPKCGLPLPNFHYYSKLTVDTIYSPPCLL